MSLGILRYVRVALLAGLLPCHSAITLAASAASAATPDRWPRVVLAADDQTQVVYDWAQERCEQWDAADAPLRAFKTDTGTVVGLASDSRDRPFTGPDLDHLKHRCFSVFRGRSSSNPADYSGLDYVTATWTPDGRHVYGLVHNEYHAETFPGACKFSDAIKCWWNAIIAVESSDAGRSFEEVQPPAVVAAPDFRQTFDQGRHRGFFNPSNIVFRDGFYYTFIGTTGGPGQRSGVCLFRTADITDVRSWRGYDGNQFKSRAIDPYRGNVSDYVACAPIEGLARNINTVVRHVPSNLFLAIIDVGNGKEWPGGGVVYQWSGDLIHWSAPTLLVSEPHFSSKDCSDVERFGYSSVLDPGSPSRNFDSVGNAAFLYQTRFAVHACRVGPNRDLIRRRIKIELSN